jgi:hypothetical protein
MRSLVAAAVFLVVYSVPMRAQEKPFHGWVALGMGTGTASVACSGGGCSSGWNLHGPTLLISLGAMLTPHWGIGVGLDEWWRSPADTESTNTATLFVHYYPSVHAGAFLEGGAGMSRAAVELDDGTIPQGRGLALMAAVGYDVRLHRVHGADISLIPRVSYVYSSIGDLEDGGPAYATEWRHQVLSLGLAIGVVGTKPSK